MEQQPRKKGVHITAPISDPPIDVCIAEGPKKRTLFFALRQHIVVVVPQARATWTEGNYFHSFVPAEKRMWHVNIDETFINLGMNIKHGFV